MCSLVAVIAARVRRIARDCDEPVKDRDARGSITGALDKIILIGRYRNARSNNAEAEEAERALQARFREADFLKSS